jgi:hypothetical protein
MSMSGLRLADAIDILLAPRGNRAETQSRPASGQAP